MATIKAGTVGDIKPEGVWVIVDIGFSEKGETCGLLIEGTGRGITERNPTTVTFAGLVKAIKTCAKENPRFDLVIEAPLSVAFKDGNPVGRTFEKQPSRTKLINGVSKRQPAKTRYWYVGLGSCVLLAAMHLLRELKDDQDLVDARITLFEGFVSYKKPGKSKDGNSHEKDVHALWNAVSTGPRDAFGAIALEGAELTSAFEIASMDFGVPPVIKVGRSKVSIYQGQSVA